jgi:hypothetical protein
VPRGALSPVRPADSHLLGVPELREHDFVECRQRPLGIGLAQVRALGNGGDQLCLGHGHGTQGIEDRDGPRRLNSPGRTDGCRRGVWRGTKSRGRSTGMASSHLHVDGAVAAAFCFAIAACLRNPRATPLAPVEAPGRWGQRVSLAGCACVPPSALCAAGPQAWIPGCRWVGGCRPRRPCGPRRGRRSRRAPRAGAS